MERLKVSVMAPYVRPWSNVELVKECITIPYLLQKNHNYDVTIVCKAPEGIPAGLYSDKDADLFNGYYPNYKYVSGLKFRFLEEGNIEARNKYLQDNIDDIDILFLRGAYELNVSLSPVYKQLRPDGTVICALDANSHWMDQIYWYVPDFVKFIESCDVVTTSCTAMANFLSIKWPWHVHSIINGFYDLSINHQHKVDFETRENIILTVGRLGTAQKATDVLLEAFAKAADKISDWKLYLVGSMDESFLSYLEDYKRKNVDILERIVFTGNISGRDELAEIYDRAKIYALTSVWEGGTNNATAEALGRGLVPVTSRIDAYEDITDHGNTGRSFEIADVDALSDILIDLCNDEKLHVMSDKVYAYADDTYDLEKITGELDGLIKRTKQ